MSFTVHALPTADLDRIRAVGVDDLGNALTTFVADGGDGTPLRCCLTDAAAGDEVALIGWRPSVLGGAYAETGPVFVHAHRCTGYAATDRYPEPFRHRRQILRAYDATGRQHSNTLVDGSSADATLVRLLDDRDVAYVHARNPLAGCYMFAVTRSAG